MMAEAVRTIANLAEGSRNSTLNTKAHTLAGLFPNDVDRIRTELTQAALKAGLTEQEIQTTLNSAIKSGLQKPILLNGSGGGAGGAGDSDRNKMRAFMAEYYQDRLQWDVMQMCYRLDGKPMSANSAWNRFEVDTNMSIQPDMYERLVTDLALANPYHGVRLYLDGLETPPHTAAAFDKLYALLGITDNLHRTFIRKWLVSAVARVYDCGCKVDTVLILQGGQGIGKTTFFQSLFGGEFFQTLASHGAEKDELMAMYRSWCIEYGEIEHTFSKKAIGQLKGFLTRQTDTFRVPYGRTVETYQRHFVLCGTTNEDDFLADATGNRRYWIVPLTQVIDVFGVANIRDEVWAAAKALYQSGDSWWLDSTEEVAATADRLQFESSDPWDRAVSAYLTTKGEPFTIAHLLECVFEMREGYQDRKTQMRVASILKGMGCKSKQVTKDGVRVRVWTKA
jgi:predicted P-loop ATPase